MAFDSGKIFFSPFNLLAKGKIIANQKYGDKPLMDYDEYPVSDDQAPLLIFWHGGSWKTGNKNMYKFVGHKMQKLGLHSFVINYPKFPQQSFPGFITDADTAISTIKARYPGRKLFLMGHSAGANTALLAGIKKHNEVEGVISFSSPNFLSARYWRPVFGNSIDDKSYDPRTHLSRINPSTRYLLLHGLLDTIVNPKDSVSLHRQMDEAGIKNKLILLKLVDHVLILPTVMVKNFIFNY
jgi:acetyl esterase/lipase